MTKIVIIGSSAAGVAAADAARKQDADASIQIFSMDKFLPYYRLRIGEVIMDTANQDVLTLHPASWYEDRKIELNLEHEVQSIDVEGKTIGLADGTTVSYDKLVLAQGSYSFVPPIQGADLPGVKTLWTMGEALDIESALGPDKSCVIIGGGLLGLETAYQTALKGVATTVIETAPRLLARQLDEKGSEVFSKQVAKMGVQTIVGANVTGIVKGTDKPLVVELSDGRKAPADLIIISTGVRPNVKILEGTGIEIKRFVVVNDKMETNIPDVYAAGDVVEQDGMWFGQWAISMGQGKAAGTNAAGGEATYKLVPPPYTINTMETKIAAGGTVSIEGEDGYNADVTTDEESLHYRKVCYQNGKVCGFVLIGETKEFMQLSKQMKEN